MSSKKNLKQKSPQVAPFANPKLAELPKKQYQESISQTKPSGKKDQGLFSFINEKLTEWPLWVKMSSYLTTEEGVADEARSEENFVNPETMYKDKKPFKLNEMPWSLFPSRERFRAVYDYYHCKSNQTTYFYPQKFAVNISKAPIWQLCTEISEPPKQLIRGFYFAVPTDLVMKQSEKSSAEKRAR